MFRVSLSTAAKDQLRILYFRAVQKDLGQIARGAFRRAALKLEGDPEAFGDPLYDLRNSRGSVRHGVSSPFLFHFVLYNVPRVVFVINVFALPASAVDID